MEQKFFYHDDIYKNEQGRFFTGMVLEHNQWLKDKYTWEKVEQPYESCQGATVCCEYSQLFYPNSSMLLCNDIVKVDEMLYDNLENGKLWRYYDAEGNEVDEEDDYVDDRPEEIYQYFLIDDSTASLLMTHTDQIVFYSELLGLYVLGVTHWGTGWDYVETEFVY